MASTTAPSFSVTTSMVPQVYSHPLLKNRYVYSPARRTAAGAPHTAYTSRSLIPGAIVPVSSETYGTSRTTAGVPWGRAGAGAVGRCASAACRAAARRAAAVSGTKGGGVGAVAVAVGLPRTLSHASFSLAVTLSTVSHPKVATVNSAHIASVLRRIASLQREEDAGTIVTAQDPSVATLRVWHDTYYVTAGIAYPGDVVRRPVRVVVGVPPDHLPAGFQERRRLGVGHVAAIAVGDRHRQLLAPLVAACERRIGCLDPYTHRPRQEPEAGVAHQRAGKQPGLTQDLESVADAQDGAAGPRVRGHRPHHRGEPGDRPRTQVVAVTEAARENHRVGLPQIGVAMPHIIGVGPGVARGVEGVRVAVRAGEHNHGDAAHQAVSTATW